MKNKKYIVWFPLRPEKAKFFSNFKKAQEYCDKQKIEACINSNVYTDNEDTVYSNGKETIL